MLVISIPVQPEYTTYPDGSKVLRHRILPDFWRVKHEDNEVLSSPNTSTDPGILVANLFDDAFRTTYPDVKTNEEVFIVLEAGRVSDEPGIEDRGAVGVLLP